MIKKYICIRDFFIDKYDDDGFVLDGEYFSVYKDSIWTINEEKIKLIGGETLLENEELGWIEISKESLKDNLKEI